MLKGIIKSLYYDFPRRFLNGRAFPCRNLMMELTYRCNLSCKMCSIQNETAVRENVKGDVELEKDEILRIIDQLPQNSNITFTGGEVFLKKGIEEILEKAANRHRVTLATNGVLLKRHSQQLIQSGVRNLGISLDGPPEVHDRVRNRKGVFGDLKKGLEVLLEARDGNKARFPIININSVILPENYASLSEIVRQVKGLRLDSCTFQVYDPSRNRSGVALQENVSIKENPIRSVEEIDPAFLRENLHKTIEEGKKHRVKIGFSPPLTVDEIVDYYQKVFDLSRWRCHLPWITMRISPYGDVYPCLNYSIGNIRENNLRELWNSDRYIRFRRLLRQKGIFEACIGCCKMFPSLTV